MRFGIVGNTSKPVIREVTASLFSYLGEKRLSFSVVEDLGRWYRRARVRPALPHSAVLSGAALARRSDMIIALGGDGTMLAAARMFGRMGVPILGINLGKLGFLAEVSVDEMRECIDDIVRKRFLIEERTALMGRAVGDDRTFFALNEVVVDRGSLSRVIDFETYVGGDFLVTYAADGIIVTTPTGSTAYSLAAGGPIVKPGSDVFVVNPISPHTLTARPVIVPDESVVRIVVREGSKRVHITADGQMEGFYRTPVEFRIRKAPYVVRLVKRRKRTYFDLLRTKLMWGRDVRIEADKNR